MELQWRFIDSGFLEPVYQESLEMEFIERAIPYNAQDKFLISYKGTFFKTHYKPDFICFQSVVIELKALSRLSSVESLS
ncbi:MAG TPA: GxxExxY protein [Pyrinomonadaceae bacterium]